MADSVRNSVSSAVPRLPAATPQSAPLTAESLAALGAQTAAIPEESDGTASDITETSSYKRRKDQAAMHATDARNREYVHGRAGESKSGWWGTIKSGVTGVGNSAAQIIKKPAALLTNLRRRHANPPPAIYAKSYSTSSIGSWPDEEGRSPEKQADGYSNYCALHDLKLFEEQNPNIRGNDEYYKASEALFKFHDNHTKLGGNQLNDERKRPELQRLIRSACECANDWSVGKEITGGVPEVTLKLRHDGDTDVANADAAMVDVDVLAGTEEVISGAMKELEKYFSNLPNLPGNAATKHQRLCHEHQQFHHENLTQIRSQLISQKSYADDNNQRTPPEGLPKSRIALSTQVALWHSQDVLIQAQWRDEFAQCLSKGNPAERLAKLPEYVRNAISNEVPLIAPKSLAKFDPLVIDAQSPPTLFGARKAALITEANEQLVRLHNHHKDLLESYGTLANARLAQLIPEEINAAAEEIPNATALKLRFVLAQDALITRAAQTVEHIAAIQGHIANIQNLTSDTNDILSEDIALSLRQCTEAKQANIQSQSALDAVAINLERHGILFKQVEPEPMPLLNREGIESERWAIVHKEFLSVHKQLGEKDTALCKLESQFCENLPRVFNVGESNELAKLFIAHFRSETQQLRDQSTWETRSRGLSVAYYAIGLEFGPSKEEAVRLIGNSWDKRRETNEGNLKEINNRLFQIEEILDPIAQSISTANVGGLRSEDALNLLSSIIQFQDEKLNLRDTLCPEVQSTEDRKKAHRNKQTAGHFTKLTSDVETVRQHQQSLDDENAFKQTLTNLNGVLKCIDDCRPVIVATGDGPAATLPGVSLPAARIAPAVTPGAQGNAALVQTPAAIPGGQGNAAVEQTAAAIPGAQGNAAVAQMPAVTPRSQGDATALPPTTSGPAISSDPAKSAAPSSASDPVQANQETGQGLKLAEPGTDRGAPNSNVEEAEPQSPPTQGDKDSPKKSETRGRGAGDNQDDEGNEGWERRGRALSEDGSEASDDGTSSEKSDEDSLEDGDRRDHDLSGFYVNEADADADANEIKVSIDGTGSERAPDKPSDLLKPVDTSQGTEIPVVQGEGTAVIQRPPIHQNFGGIGNLSDAERDTDAIQSDQPAGPPNRGEIEGRGTTVQPPNDTDKARLGELPLQTSAAVLQTDNDQDANSSHNASSGGDNNTGELEEDSRKPPVQFINREVTSQTVTSSFGNPSFPEELMQSGAEPLGGSIGSTTDNTAEQTQSMENPVGGNLHTSDSNRTGSSGEPDDGSRQSVGWNEGVTDPSLLAASSTSLKFNSRNEVDARGSSARAMPQPPSAIPADTIADSAGNEAGLRANQGLQNNATDRRYSSSPLGLLGTLPDFPLLGADALSAGASTAANASATQSAHIGSVVHDDGRGLNLRRSNRPSTPPTGSPERQQGASTAEQLLDQRQSAASPRQSGQPPVVTDAQGPVSPLHQTQPTPPSTSGTPENDLVSLLHAQQQQIQELRQMVGHLTANRPPSPRGPFQNQAPQPAPMQRSLDTFTAMAPISLSKGRVQSLLIAARSTKRLIDRTVGSRPTIDDPVLFLGGLHDRVIQLEERLGNDLIRAARNPESSDPRVLNAGVEEAYVILNHAQSVFEEVQRFAQEASFEALEVGGNPVTRGAPAEYVPFTMRRGGDPDAQDWSANGSMSPNDIGGRGPTDRDQAFPPPPGDQGNDTRVAGVHDASDLLETPATTANASAETQDARSENSNTQGTGSDPSAGTDGSAARPAQPPPQQRIGVPPGSAESGAQNNATGTSTQHRVEVVNTSLEPSIREASSTQNSDGASPTAEAVGDNSSHLSQSPSGSASTSSVSASQTLGRQASNLQVSNSQEKSKQTNSPVAPTSALTEPAPTTQAEQSRIDALRRLMRETMESFDQFFAAFRRVAQELQNAVFSPPPATQPGDGASNTRGINRAREPLSTDVNNPLARRGLSAAPVASEATTDTPDTPYTPVEDDTEEANNRRRSQNQAGRFQSIRSTLSEWVRLATSAPAAPPAATSSGSAGPDDVRRGSTEN